MSADEQRHARLAQNEATFREANESIARAAEAMSDTPALVPFLCECASPACTEVVRLSLDDYREARAAPRRFVVVAGHELAEIEQVVRAIDGCLLVEKRLDD